MKKRMLITLTAVMLALMPVTGLAEGIFSSLFSQPQAAEPVYTPVELPAHGGLVLFGLSPDGDYLAYREDGSSFGLIRDGIYTPFVRSDSRGVPDEYGCLDDWEALRWIDHADDPVWSPDGRWLILTAYTEVFMNDNSFFPVLIDTRTNEYFLLCGSSFEHGNLEDCFFFITAAFTPDSRQLIVVYKNSDDVREGKSTPSIFRWDLFSGKRTDLNITVSYPEHFFDAEMERLTEQYQNLPRKLYDNYEAYLEASMAKYEKRYSEKYMKNHRDELVENCRKAWDESDYDSFDAYLSENLAAYKEKIFVDLLGPLYFMQDGSAVCDFFCFEYDHRNNTVGARLTFTQDDRVICELKPVNVPEADLIYQYGVAGQEIVVFHDPSGISGEVEPPYFFKAAFDHEAVCFFPVYDPESSDLWESEMKDAFRILTDEALFEPTLAEFMTRYKIYLLDYALSPDGKSMVLSVAKLRGYYEEPFLLHIRLEDLRLTVLPLPEGTKLPQSYPTIVNYHNNHFIWSREGTLLITFGEDAYAFRID